AFGGFQVRVAVGGAYPCPFTNGFNNVVCRKTIGAGAQWAPGLICRLGIIEKYFRIPDMRFIMSLVVGRSWIEVYILTKQFAQIVTGPCGSFYPVQCIVRISIGSSINDCIVRT